MENENTQKLLLLRLQRDAVLNELDNMVRVRRHLSLSEIRGYEQKLINTLETVMRQYIPCADEEFKING